MKDHPALCSRVLRVRHPFEPRISVASTKMCRHGARVMQSERDRAIAKICELIIECGSPPDRPFSARQGPHVQDVEKKLRVMSRTLLGVALTTGVWNE